MIKGLISVIVPVYNVEQYLERCVESIINQTYDDLEIFLIDDGSTDSSSTLCDELSERDNRILVIHKDNKGLSDARNIGIESASGEYLCFIDSDDFIHSTYIERLYSLCQENECEIGICNYKRTSSDEIEYVVTRERGMKIYTTLEMIENIYNDLYEISTVAWNKLYRWDVIADIRYPVGIINEDEATTCRFLYNAKKILLTYDILYFYYQRPDSIMGQGFSLKKLDYLKALEIRMEFYECVKLKKYYDKDCLLYLYRVMNFYYMIKKHYADRKDILGELKNGYRKVYGRSDKSKWSLKKRMILWIAFFFPQFRECIMKIKNGKT